MTLTETIDISVLQALYVQELPTIQRASSIKGKKSKSVTFCRNLENVRYFRCEEPAMSIRTLNEQKAQEVTPYYAIRSAACRMRALHDTANKLQENPVILDIVQLRYPYLEFIVYVKNISYQKRVTIHYSLDNWATSSDVEAKYEKSESMWGMDRFMASVDVSACFLNSSIASSSSSSSSSTEGSNGKVMTFALCYETDGKSFWDNNGGSDYRVDFISQKPASSPSSSPKLPALQDLDLDRDELPVLTKSTFQSATATTTTTSTTTTSSQLKLTLPTKPVLESVLSGSPCSITPPIMVTRSLWERPANLHSNHHHHHHIPSKIHTLSLTDSKVAAFF